MEAHPNAAVTTELNRQWIEEQWEKRSKCDQCLTPVDPLAWDAVKILPCLHILCNDVCVEKNKSEEDEGIGCPKCFHIVGVTEMNECLEFGLAIHRNERRLLCTHCTQGKRAYFFCKDCDDPMCDGCNGGHLFLRRSASHVVVPITSDFKFPESMESVKCDDHLKVEAVEYCNTCENALCAQCGGDQTHAKHEVQAMDVYLDGLWKKVQDTTHKIKEFVPKTETIESEIKNQQRILLDYKNSEPFKRTKKNLKRIIELLIRAEIKVRGELKAAQQKKYGTWDKKIHFLRAVKLKTAHFVENLGDGPKLANHDLLANRKIIQKRLEKMNTDVMVCERLPIDDESEDEDCSSNVIGVEPMEIQSCGNKRKSVAAKKSDEPLPSTSTSRAVRNQCSRLISKYVNPTEFSEEEWELIATAEDLPDGSDDDESDSENDEDQPGQAKMVSMPLGAVSGTPVKNAFDSSKVMNKSVVANGVSVQTVGHLELIPDNKEEIDKTTVIVKNCEQAMDLKETPDFETKKTSVKMMNGESKGNNPDSGVLNKNQDTKNSTEDIGNPSKKLNEQINIAGIGVKFEIPLKDVVGTSDPEDSSKVEKLTENGVKKNESGGGGSTVEMNGNGGGLEGDFLAPPSKPAKPEKAITPDVSKNGDSASSSQVKPAIIPKKRPVSEIVVENLPVKKVIRSRCSLGAVQPVKKSVAEPSSGYKRKIVESDSDDTEELESAKDEDSGDRKKRSLRIRDRKKAVVAPPPPPPPPPPTPPPNKSRRSSTSGRGRGPGRPAKVRDPIVITKEVESTKPKVDVSPVPGEVESAAPTNPTCTAPPQVATIAPIKRTSTAPLKLTSIQPPQVATTAPAKLTNTAPAQVASTEPSQVASTAPAQVASTAPAQVASTAPAQVASTAPAEVTSTVTVKPERAIPIEGECSVCLVTGQGEMLICDSCLLIYHNTCHLPAMAGVSPDEWYCIVCRDMGGLEKPSPAATTDLEFEKARMLEVPSPLPRADFLRACRFLAVMLHYTRCQAMLRHVGSRNKMQGEEEFLNFDMIRMRLTLATPTPYANATDIIKDIETMIRQSRNFFTTKNNAHGIDTVEAVQKIFLDTMHTYYPKWKQILEPETGILHFEVSN